jgi:hypothetical protein
MKNKTIASITRLSVSIMLLIILAESSAISQYELSWYTIDGGGGRSSGGPYVLMGTIGQPDAAYSSGSQYELLGGFWPGGPICIVSFDDYARFAELWRHGGAGIAADLDGNEIVDFKDLREFTDVWLSCCPVGWPLK